MFKRHFLLISILAVCISVSATEKETRNVGSFNDVKVFGKFDVVLVKGTEESIMLESETTGLEKVMTEVENGQLKIRMKVNYFEDKEIKVVINYKQLKDITAGAGAFIDAGTMEAAKFGIQVNSGANIKAEVIADSLIAEVTEGATLDLSGKVKYHECTVRTGGQLNGYLLNSDAAKVKVTMGGYVKIMVREKLEASVTMGGNISYKGNPKEVKRSDTLGGSITEIRE